MKKALYRLEIYHKQSATESEKEVLNFILEHPRTVVEMDIHTLAKSVIVVLPQLSEYVRKMDLKDLKN